MEKATKDMLQADHYILFIHSPFCGTCQLARSMLHQIEEVHQQDIFLEMNASLHPSFMQENKIESVPCLCIKDQGQIKEKVYVFHSIANIYHILLQYERKLFVNSH
ncbi:thioredoxin family protein [Virgibacillus halophilus]|uniref:Thioredoxin family protein n=1 Tax=Tigheibacillus halophilus TaxID=361280 RepID=A0ABU5C9I1_9BACI|nr:thioredoxin family protein [Virgibacillus halophilus]